MALITTFGCVGKSHYLTVVALLSLSDNGSTQAIISETGRCRRPIGTYSNAVC
jgi:hypothetical protein